MPSALKPILSDSAERDDAADDREPAATRWRFSPRLEREGLDGDPAGRDLALGLAVSGGSRTATAHVETPRIITPSRTAWPPTGASRVAISAPVGKAG